MPTNTKSVPTSTQICDQCKQPMTYITGMVQMVRKNKYKLVCAVCSMGLHRWGWRVAARQKDLGL